MPLRLKRGATEGLQESICPTVPTRATVSAHTQWYGVSPIPEKSHILTPCPPDLAPPRPAPPLHLIAPYSSMKAPDPAGSSTAGDQKSSGAGVVPNAAWAAGTATPAVSSAVSRAPTDSEVSAMVSLSSLFSSRRISSGVSVGSTARVDTMRATLRAVGEHGGEMRF